MGGACFHSQSSLITTVVVAKPVPNQKDQLDVTESFAFFADADGKGFATPDALCATPITQNVERLAASMESGQSVGEATSAEPPAHQPQRTAPLKEEKVRQLPSLSGSPEPLEDDENNVNAVSEVGNYVLDTELIDTFFAASQAVRAAVPCPSHPTAPEMRTTHQDGLSKAAPGPETLHRKRSEVGNFTLESEDDVLIRDLLKHNEEDQQKHHQTQEQQKQTQQQQHQKEEESIVAQVSPVQSPAMALMLTTVRAAPSPPADPTSSLPSPGPDEGLGKNGSALNESVLAKAVANRHATPANKAGPVETKEEPDAVRPSQAETAPPLQTIQPSASHTAKVSPPATTQPPPPTTGSESPRDVSTTNVFVDTPGASRNPGSATRNSKVNQAGPEALEEDAPAKVKVMPMSKAIAVAPPPLSAAA